MADETYGGLSLPSSGGGVKLLSANPRALVKIQTGGLLPGGLSTQLLSVPAMVEAHYGVNANFWPLKGNTRVKLSGGVTFGSAGAGQVSLESAAMEVALIDALGVSQAVVVNAARLSSTTALAQDLPVSYDEFLVDHNDMKLLAPAAVAFVVTLRFVLNNTGGTKAYTVAGMMQANQAQFSGYKFDRWE